MTDYSKHFVDGVDLQDFDRLDIHQIERDAARMRAEYIADNSRAFFRAIGGLFRSGKSGAEAGSAA